MITCFCVTDTRTQPIIVKDGASLSALFGLQKTRCPCSFLVEFVNARGHKAYALGIIIEICLCAALFFKQQQKTVKKLSNKPCQLLPESLTSKCDIKLRHE